MKQEIHIPDNIALHELMTNQHGLFGEVTIHRRNKKTGEVTFWYQDHNIIPISGMQWILMKMFGLYLDTSHGSSYDEPGRDTTLVIPELNQVGIMGIGVPTNRYDTMSENISSSHIIQGFMVGNGGAGEDQLTAKNTDYSFINLRNPIPFQQTQDTLPSEIAWRYMGRLQTPVMSSFAKSYYIKTFDETPHIYHSWWRDGQRWNYIDPVVPADLGPNATNGAGKTNRIETYAECKLTIDETDFKAYFTNDGNTQTPVINELGLVAFDRTPSGERTKLEDLYRRCIKPIINIAFKNPAETMSSVEEAEQMGDYIVLLASEAYETLTSINGSHSDPTSPGYHQANLEVLTNTMWTLMSQIPITRPLRPQSLSAFLVAAQNDLMSDENIAVKPLYNQDHVYESETDSYLNIVSSLDYNEDGIDEAQRIKLITYYTFKSIPIEENWETVINYRIYAN